MFDLVSKSVIGEQIGQDYPLQDAARAHADLEARRTIGATVLIP
jgi:NADPH2:quinone reductase